MRLFVALSISASVRENLSSLLDELRRADSRPRWVNPTNLHVTLKFIGHVPDENLSNINSALCKVRGPAALTLHFRGVGFFPDERRPTVVWVGVQAPAELAALAACIDESLAGWGIQRETRPFSPHLALARFKETRLTEALRALLQRSNNRSFGEQLSTEFHLMESKPKPTGAEYTTLRSFPFALEELNR
jgi:RNA 2',3'-cyclic 3'-phosphodiesterase